MKISEIITRWYKKNSRELPWRETRDPYRIWLSEIILQQTRISQGLAYYQRFTTQFPDIFSLAAASEQEVIKAWQGLGYYSRARNLHAAARQVVDGSGGTFPATRDDLLRLKGVGPYTAAAVASIAYSEPVAAVDGNVARVISRLFAVGEPVNTPRGERRIGELAGELLNHEEPGEHNQAMMEFGALQCVPVNPDCNGCPLNNLCMARSAGTVADYPVKVRKARVKKRYFTYLVILHDSHTYIHRRTSNDIWKQMYQFPLAEHEKLPEEKELPLIAGSMTGALPETFSIHHVSPPVKHQLTHQLITARFVHIELNINGFRAPDDWERVLPEKVGEYPLPRLIDRYLELKAGTQG